MQHSCTAQSEFFTGSGGDSREFVFTLLDGNTSTDPDQNLDLTDPSNSRSGTFSYSISAVSEPSSGLLMASALAGLAPGRGKRAAPPRPWPATPPGRRGGSASREPALQLILSA